MAGSPARVATAEKTDRSYKEEPAGAEVKPTRSRCNTLSYLLGYEDMRKEPRLQNTSAAKHKAVKTFPVSGL